MNFTVWIKLKFQDDKYTLDPNYESAYQLVRTKEELFAQVRTDRGRYIYKEGDDVEFCRASPFTTPDLAEVVTWGDKNKEKDLFTYPFVWPDKLYDPIYLHPEFPHLTSDRQG